MTSDLSSMPQLEPGIYKDIDFQTYLDLPYVNSGACKDGLISMKRMHANITGQIEDKETTDRKFGRAEHCYILEGKEEFYQRHLISDDCCAILSSGDNAGMPCGKTGKKTDGSNWFCGSHCRGREDLTEPTEFVSKGELERIERIAESVREHPCMAALKRPGWSELTLVWDMHGMRFKARCDRATFEGKHPMIVDLKKHDRSDLTHDEIDKVISRYRYYLQASLYVMGAEILTGTRPHFMWVFTESHPPFDVLPVMMPHSMFEHGKLWVDYIAREYAKCERLKHFPGVHDMDRPATAMLTKWEQMRDPEQEHGGEDAVNNVASV